MVKIIGVQKINVVSKKTGKPFRTAIVHCVTKELIEDSVGEIPRQVFIDYDLYPEFCQYVGLEVEFETKTDFVFGKMQTVITGVK